MSMTSGLIPLGGAGGNKGRRGSNEGLGSLIPLGGGGGGGKTNRRGSNNDDFDFDRDQLSPDASDSGDGFDAAFSDLLDSKPSSKGES